ncbi:MAG: OmpA family protein [Flavobacterium sp.]|nr:OmpA family protein [Flavobacterium sp.]
MKNPKLTLLFLLFSIVLYSQKVIYYDTFENNKGNWESTNTNYKSSIHKGKLVIENSDPSSTKWHLVSAIDNPDDVDFDIEAKIEVVKSEKDNSTYGLVWSCYTDNKYYDVVRMTPDKRVQLYEYQDGTFDYYKDWTTEKFINGYKKENKILVQKRANVVKIYINDKLYYQAGWYTYYGSKVGFILDAQMTIEVDELKVTEYPKKINVVETFNPNLKMEKLPTTVSSEEYEETNPVVSPDGKYLFVTRKDCPLNIDSNKDDIWYSEKDTKGNWTTLKNMGRPLNNRDYNFVISTSPDNNTFLLGNRYATDGLSANGQGISISRKTTTGWEIPKDVVIKDYVNTNDYVGFFLSNDNQHLLMAVERPEGEGKKDLYVSFLNEDDTWTKPMSLGKVVNTFEEETNPFLASDGKTLYFSSKGHPGYGGYDLFVTKRLDDTWKNWSTPQNLGNVINSAKTELSIFLTAKGDKAYVGRSKDIWEITNTVKQDPVVLIKGKVFDSKTKKVLSAPIVYNNLLTNKELGTAISDPTTGAYSIVLPYGQRYSFMAQKEGYYAVTENVDVSSLTDYKEIVVDLYLNPIEKGQTIRLNNIFFDSGKYDLLPESNAELDRLYKVLKENQKLKIEIAGHTDAVGSDANNMTLSNNRANAVMQYLVTKGIGKERLTSKGYGETKFIATNDTEEGKQLNRRVEFVILEL